MTFFNLIVIDVDHWLICVVDHMSDILARQKLWQLPRCFLQIFIFIYLLFLWKTTINMT